MTTVLTQACASSGWLVVRSIGLGSVQIPVTVAAPRSDGVAITIGRVCRVFPWSELRAYSMFEAQTGEDPASLVVHVGPYREELVVDTASDAVLLEWTSVLRSHGLQRVTVSYGFD